MRLAVRKKKTRVRATQTQAYKSVLPNAAFVALGAAIYGTCGNSRGNSRGAVEGGCLHLLRFLCRLGGRGHRRCYVGFGRLRGDWCVTRPLSPTYTEATTSSIRRAECCEGIVTLNARTDIAHDCGGGGTHSGRATIWHYPAIWPLLNIHIRIVRGGFATRKEGPASAFQFRDPKKCRQHQHTNMQ